MKKNRVFMFAAAVAALLLAGCDKEQQGYDSFILDIAGFSGADGSKASWNNSGFWWTNTENASDGDYVRINGDVHQIFRAGNQWKTRKINTEDGNVTAPVNNDQYYIAYAGNGEKTLNLGWDEDSKLYGPVVFDSTIVPLARSGSGNKMTLDPCCAVIKITTGFAGSLSFDDVDGMICSEGKISPAEAVITDGSSLLDTDDPAIYPCAKNIDGYDYFIIPMEGSSVTCKIITDNGDETAAKTLRKGVLYVVNVSE